MGATNQHTQDPIKQRWLVQKREVEAIEGHSAKGLHQRIDSDSTSRRDLAGGLFIMEEEKDPCQPLSDLDMPEQGG